MEGKTKANAAKEKENKDRSSKMVIVKNLIEKGKKNGTLTYKEIMDEIDHIIAVIGRCVLQASNSMGKYRVP